MPSDGRSLTTVDLVVDRAVVRGPPSGLWGRRDERARLDEMIAAVRGGESRTLVLRGEAGVGKTALLDYAVGAASGLRVVRAVGVESEMELAFAAVHQLCAPMLDHLERLPAPQREALEIVFGLSRGPAPDRFLVGLAVLSLLSEVAEERPLLCAVDDAQWLDRASAQVMAFVARRLLAESVAVVFAAREPGAELRGLPELEVEGLGTADARALLGSVVRFPLDERVRDRIVAETRGNPLALLELPRGLTPTQLAGGFGLLGAGGLSGRIETSFRARLGGLPYQSRAFLLVAAVESVGDPRLVWSAAERLGIDGSASAAAEADGLLAIGQQVTFRHPLVRSAVYRSASVRDRRAAHLALAEVTDPQLDPDRRAWHLAAAAPGPDEEVASQLERSAGRAQARGGLAAAAAFLQRSLELTRDPEKRAERALAAAQASLRAGAFDAALGLLVAAQAGPLDEFQHARIELLRGQVAFSSGAVGEAPQLLLKAAKRLEPLDLELARETYLDAWGAARFAERVGAGDLPEISHAVAALPPSGHPPRPVDVLLDGLALLITRGRDAAAETLRRATRAFASEDVPVEDGLAWGWMALTAPFLLWDEEGVGTICARQIHLARKAGALEQLPFYLAALAVAAAQSGDLAEAASLMVEAKEVTAATGTRLAPYGALFQVALRGSEAEAVALIEATLRQAADHGQGLAASAAHWTAAVLYNGLGRYDLALAAAQRATADPLDLHPSAWALPELIEAATRSGHIPPARDALARLTVTTRPAGTAFARGIEARSRALLSEGDLAESLYREAIERLSRSRARPDLARAHLLYGERLRRDGRRLDARQQLRTAYDMFVAIGMEAFAGRARRELFATGATVRGGTVATRDELTAQERQVAQLARDGLSNPEIGARLFISARTVQYHLHKVFSKLDIKSRNELHRVLASDPTQAQ